MNNVRFFQPAKGLVKSFLFLTFFCLLLWELPLSLFAESVVDGTKLDQVESFYGSYYTIEKVSSSYKRLVTLRLAPTSDKDELIIKLEQYANETTETLKSAIFLIGKYKASKKELKITEARGYNYAWQGQLRLSSREGKTVDLVLTRKKGGDLKIEFPGFNHTYKPAKSDKDIYLEFLTGIFKKNTYGNMVNITPVVDQKNDYNELLVSMPFDKMKQVITHEVLKARWRPRDRNQQFNLDEVEEILRRLFIRNSWSRMDVGAMLSHFPNLKKIEVYPPTNSGHGQKDYFNLKATRVGGQFGFDFELSPSEGAAASERARWQRITEEQEQKRLAFIARIDAIKAKLPEADRIDFSTIKMSNAAFGEYLKLIYYGQFDRANEYRFDRRSVFTNFHLAMSSTYKSRLSGNSDYQKQVLSRGEIERTVYVRRKYARDLNIGFQTSVFEVNDLITVLFAAKKMSDFNEIKNDFPVLVKALGPGTGAHQRMSENLFRFLKKMTPLR